MADKNSLRHEALRHRDRIDPGSEDTEAACTLFFDTLKPQKGQVVALYWPKGREFDVCPITEQLLKQGFTCALPVIQKGSRELKFAAWNENVPLVVGPYEVQHPAIDQKTKWVDPDIVVVPLLAFDRRGYRLGYGSGYYDATLQALRQKKNITAVGLGYAKQAVLFSLPVEEHDQKLDWVITPQKAHQFN